MLTPVRVDAAADLAFGLLLALAIGVILAVDTVLGLAFGLGVFGGYLIHVGWKMARFDPDWMTEAVRESVDETVEETVVNAMQEVQDDAEATATSDTQEKN